MTALVTTPPTTPVTPAGPLGGIVVIDLSRALAGPHAAMMLGDLGARVIKVETPERGDVTRGRGPPVDPSSGLSAYYRSINRNTESIVLDPRTESARESVARLPPLADRPREYVTTVVHRKSRSPPAPDRPRPAPPPWSASARPAPGSRPPARRAAGE